LKALEVTAEPRFRSVADGFVEAWRLHAPYVGSESVALALVSASTAADRCRHEQSVDLVWTGPDIQAIPMRRTDQVLLEVIESARRSLLIVSFAVYRIPAISRAIVQAANRGVLVKICVEWSDSDTSDTGYDTIRGLGQAVVAHTAIFAWPRENRPKDRHGRSGILHVKLAVADEALVFISSANLTEYAMNLNMELGVLVRGGQLPGKVVTHFNRLLSSGVLRPVVPSKE
jgi:phosphatidylserine/phosphatidylglycerophosphate/cardiolipin synthase-like enzyme